MKRIHHTKLIVILLFLMMGNSLKANVIIDSLKIRLALVEDEQERSKIAKLIGDNYYSINQDSIIVYYELAEKYANLSTTTFVDDIDILRGYGYYNTSLTNDYEKAIIYYEEAIQIAKKNNDRRNIALIQNDLGIIFWKKGIYEKAIEYHFMADKIAEDIDDANLRMRTLLSLGVIHNEALRNEEAKIYYEEALLLAKGVGHQRAIGVIQNNIGQVLQDIGDYTNSQTQFQKALIIFQNLSDDYWKGLCYYNLGNNSFLQKEYKTTIDYYNKALTLNKILQDKDREVMILSGLAQTYEALKQYKIAIQYALKGEKLLKEFDTQLHHSTLISILARCYQGQGNFEKSNIYYQKNFNSTNIIESENQEQVLAKMKAMYTNEKKNNLIDQLEIINKQELIKRQRATYIFRFTSLIFLFILALLGLLFYVLKLRQLNKYNALRSKLTYDLHDNIGSSLNQIKILSSKLNNNVSEIGEQNNLSKISRIKTISNDLISNMYDLIWSIDKDKESLEDLIAHMRDHASNVFSPMDLPFKMKINSNYKNKVIDADVKNNIYAVYKEAINNVVKHTRPALVYIYIDVINNQMNLKVENDKSVTLDDQYSSKKGLLSMVQRAKSIGGKLNIENETDKFIINLQVNV